ncbi:hypothetical protein HUG17_2286 [Dermatophagoides farinae]|uniref:Uncharacterized protein n=1 Tax=Dermatophagoides farinae TaxID=6954 RepID=A0A9D4SM10_DERFA|nr:KICSTOR complex protein ITFG2-like [Dermatophagoides farinae]KAH7646748.1 hypothetical protein HUG17_2286 [Dermatophagoides farinae]
MNHLVSNKIVKNDNGNVQQQQQQKIDELVSNSSTPSHSSSISRTQSSSSTSFIATSHTNCSRSLSLVDSIEFKFDGNISKNALALGDCDNDEKNELVIGTLNGELLIYKNDCKNPQASTKDLGMVACILVGDILNVGSNYIISISIEGYLKIFHMYYDSQIDLLNQSNDSAIRRQPKFSNSSLQLSNMKLPPTISDNEVYSSTTNLVLVHTQQMQSNTMCALLVDFDHDDKQELLVALSDRVVRCYRAVNYNEEIKLIGLYKWEFSDQIGSITLHHSFDSNTGDSYLMNDDNKSNNSSTEDKKSICKNRICVLVSQFGGVFAKITCCEHLAAADAENDDDHVKNNDEIEPISVEYCDTIVQYTRNRQTSAEILSNIRRIDSNENLIALATHDGTLILLESDQKTIKWHLQLEHPILSLHKHDLNNDGSDELIITVWNGLVYIIDLDGNIITCHFNQPINAFTVGPFYLNDNLEQIDCFVYTTFTNSVHLFYNIDSTLFNNIDMMDDYPLEGYIRKHRPELYKQMENLLKKLNNDNGNNQSNKQLKMSPDLIHTLLYEIPFQ